MNILDFPTRRQLPLRKRAAVAFVVHNTGETDLDKILKFYSAEDGYQPHFFVETTGTIRRIVAEDHVAWHAKIDEAEARLYMLGYGTWSQWSWNNEQPFHLGYEFPGYFEWRTSWRSQGVQSPIGLVTGQYPNATSIGIELQKPILVTPDIFTDAQYEALAWLLVEEGHRLQIPIDRQHVLGHYDVSPMRRCNSTGNWDPGFAFRWNRLWDLVRKTDPRS